MGLFNDWRRRKKPDEKGQLGFEFYEDTHDDYGDYLGANDAYSAPQRPYSAPFSAHSGSNGDRYFRREQDIAPEASAEKSFKLPDSNQAITPRNYQNVVVYKPNSFEDVQTLIDFLKRREPAIVNLDDTDPDFSQRILDFVSGAIYALSGSVHRIAGNIFLLSPEGVEITVPYGK